MQSLILSLETITPIFLMMLLGYFLKSIKLVTKDVFDGINKMIFKVFLPILLFNNIYTTDSLKVFDGKLVLYLTISVLVIFALGLGAVFIITKDNSRRGVIWQSFFRSNFAILGVPIVNYLCPGGSNGLVSLMVAIVVPLFNILAVIALEFFNGGHINFKKIIIGIIKNPLIISCIIGLSFLLLDFTLPAILEKTVSDVSKVASPLAIVVLGASFTFKSIKGYIKENIIVLISRLVIVPLIVLSVSAAIGFRDEAFACLLVVFAGPIAVSSFSMAQQMGGDENLASQVVVLTSVFCIPTLFAWIYIFSSLGII